MDIMDMRVVITLLSFACFIGIVVWAFSGRQKSRFDEAANLPFADDEMQQRTIERAGLAPEDASGKPSVQADRQPTDINHQSGGQGAARRKSEQEVPHG
jgi:cytochrome c oxidase cbb3-type subunit 4